MNRDLKIISIALFTWALGEGLFLTFVPLYLEELGARPQQIGTILASSSLARTVVMLPAGMAADRWGGRGVMIYGWVLGFITALMLAAATQLWVFAVAWVLYGATAWVIPPLTSYIANARGKLTPERALTAVFASFPAGLIISPAVGGQIAKHLGLRAPFVVAIAFFLISTIAICFVRAQERTAVSIQKNPGQLFHNYRFLALMVLLFLVTLSLWLGNPLAPNFLQDRWEIDVSQVGLLGSVGSLGGVTMALFLGRRSPRVALASLLAAGMIYLVVMLNVGQVGWLATAFFLRGSVPLARQFIDSISARIVSPSQQGLAFASSATVQQAGNAVAERAAGSLYALQPALPFQTGLVLIPIALCVTGLLVPRICRNIAVTLAPGVSSSD